MDSVTGECDTYQSLESSGDEGYATPMLATQPLSEYLRQQKVNVTEQSHVNTHFSLMPVDDLGKKHHDYDDGTGKHHKMSRKEKRRQRKQQQATGNTSTEEGGLMAPHSDLGHHHGDGHKHDRHGKHGHHSHSQKRSGEERSHHVGLYSILPELIPVAKKAEPLAATTPLNCGYKPSRKQRDKKKRDEEEEVEYLSAKLGLDCHRGEKHIKKDRQTKREEEDDDEYLSEKLPIDCHHSDRYSNKKKKQTKREEEEEDEGMATPLPLSSGRPLPELVKITRPKPDLVLLSTLKKRQPSAELCTFSSEVTPSSTPLQSQLKSTFASLAFQTVDSNGLKAGVTPVESMPLACHTCPHYYVNQYYKTMAQALAENDLPLTEGDMDVIIIIPRATVIEEARRKFGATSQAMHDYLAYHILPGINFRQLQDRLNVSPHVQLDTMLLDHPIMVNRTVTGTMYVNEYFLITHDTTTKTSTELLCIDEGQFDMLVPKMAVMPKEVEEEKEEAEVVDEDSKAKVTPTADDSEEDLVNEEDTELVARIYNTHDLYQAYKTYGSEGFSLSEATTATYLFKKIGVDNNGKIMYKLQQGEQATLAMDAMRSEDTLFCLMACRKCRWTRASLESITGLDFQPNAHAPLAVPPSALSQTSGDLTIANLNDMSYGEFVASLTASLLSEKSGAPLPFTDTSTLLSINADDGSSGSKKSKFKRFVRKVKRGTKKVIGRKQNVTPQQLTVGEAPTLLEGDTYDPKRGQSARYALKLRKQTLANGKVDVLRGIAVGDLTKFELRQQGDEYEMRYKAPSMGKRSLTDIFPSREALIVKGLAPRRDNTRLESKDLAFTYKPTGSEADPLYLTWTGNGVTYTFEFTGKMFTMLVIQFTSSNAQLFKQFGHLTPLEAELCEFLAAELCYTEDCATAGVSHLSEARLEFLQHHLETDTQLAKFASLHNVITLLGEVTAELSGLADDHKLTFPIKAQRLNSGDLYASLSEKQLETQFDSAVSGLAVPERATLDGCRELLYNVNHAYSQMKKADVEASGISIANSLFESFNFEHRTTTQKQQLCNSAGVLVTTLLHSLYTLKAVKQLSVEKKDVSGAHLLAYKSLTGLCVSFQ
jgi:hypothetical protein